MIDFNSTPQGLTKHVLQKNGCPLHYWLGGPEEKPLVVFMHGATMDHRMFNAQVAALIPRYRVLVWDARGHGQSQPIGENISLEIFARDMLDILDEMQVKQAIIGGQSMGGYIAQHIYLLAPQRVQGMIIIGSTPITKAYNQLEIWALKASLPIFHIWPYKHLQQTVAQNTAQKPAVQAYAQSAVQQIQKDDFLKIWRTVTLAINHKGLPQQRFDVPLLFIHGDGDTTGTIKRDMPLWAKWEKNVTYQVIPNAGHNANQDNAEFTNDLILKFLQNVFAPESTGKE